ETPDMQPDSAETRTLLDRIAGGDAHALSELLGRHRERLGSFVDLHLDAPMRGPVGGSHGGPGAPPEGVRRVGDSLLRRADALPPVAVQDSQGTPAQPAPRPGPAEALCPPRGRPAGPLVAAPGPAAAGLRPLAQPARSGPRAGGAHRPGSGQPVGAGPGD